MKLNITPDCGNSPKKKLVKNLTIYFATYDLDNAMEFMEDTIQWNLVGDIPIEGKQGFREALEQMKHNKVAELTIDRIITHGKEAAVNGDMLMENGSVFGFSDFYDFSSAKGTKVKKIVSYVIEKK
ncbi:nuclear transport factor 2 family protein [Allomuricauda sp. NBRC 101325]|uniref:nuclear transport factor 2 family protein n=1 Tax=Allomuricauda sp. NBRC 101325 TaxID=1113758 RepID=UPI0025540257|nr:nuclear transport factor 2 family protein [Muricauda sp. NBRC 101325]